MRAAAYQPFGKTLSQPGVAEDLMVVDKNRMEQATKVSLITDRAVLLLFDSDDAPAEGLSFELSAGESYYDDDILINGKIRFVNKYAGETPRVRGIVWGV